MLSWITRTISSFKCVTRVEPQCAVERTRGGDSGRSVPVRERQRSAETTAGVRTFNRPGEMRMRSHIWPQRSRLGTSWAMLANRIDSGRQDNIRFLICRIARDFFCRTVRKLFELAPGALHYKK